MSIKHGVFVYENDTALSAPITVDSAVQVVIGTAPVWMLDKPEDVTNKPILCTTATEAMETFGYLPDFATWTLCQTMYLTANVFPVSPVVYINVLDVATMKGTATDVELDAPISTRVVLTQSNVIKKLVSITQNNATLVKDQDYTLEYDSTGKLVVNFITGTGSSFDSTKDTTISVTCATPASVTGTEIIGSHNTSTGVTTGAELIQLVYPRLGVVPSIILAPGYSQISAVGIALAAKASNINGVFKGMAVVDIDTTQATVYSNVKTVKESSGFTSPFCQPIWPSFKIGTDVFAGSAVAAALMAYTDAQNGGIPARSPSNKLMGITGTCLASGVEVVLNQDQGTTINAGGVTTAINLNGWRLWGNYTGAYPATTDVKDMWVPVRRMFNWQANNFILTYFDKVDDPLNVVLVESIVDSENIRCAAYTPDSWAGAEIQYLEADNPRTDLLAGKIVFRQRIAPYTPAQEIDNILSYDTTMLANSLSGLA